MIAIRMGRDHIVDPTSPVVSPDVLDDAITIRTVTTINDNDGLLISTPVEVPVPQRDRIPRRSVADG